MKKLSTFLSLALVVLALGFSQQARADWYVAGSPAAVFNGENWNPAAEVNKMVLQDDGTYKFESLNVQIPNTNIEFKVTNGTWDEAYPSSNYSIAIQTAGYYDVVITFNPETNEVNGTATLKQAVEAEDEYIIAGNSDALFGTTWDANNTENQMQLNEDGTYSKTYEEVELSAGTILYKFIKNGGWESGANRELAISKAGLYNVTFTYYPTLSDGEAVATLLEEIEIEITSMSVTGELTGGWATDEDQDGVWEGYYVDMDQDATSGSIWTLTVEDVELTAGDYNYKVCANHNWYDYALPFDGDYTYACEEDGIYTLVFTANTSDNTVTLEATKTGNIEPEEFTELYILGEVGDNNWAPNVGFTIPYKGESCFEATDVTFKGANEGVSYFSFTTKLAESADDWEGIAQYRYGAVTEDGSDFWVTDDCLGIDISLQPGETSFRIPAGVYKLFVNMTDKVLNIEKTGDYSGTTETAIQNVENNANSTVYYNLQGQRVSSPEKGIYINNGRKVIVK